MSDRLCLNRTRHCSLCPSTFGGRRNFVRERLGGVEDGDGPRIAICPVHDVAGPVDLLPKVLRLVTEGRRLA